MFVADSPTIPPKKKTRRPTTLPEFTSKRPTGYRYPIEFDQCLEPLGELAAKFKSYVSLLARSKASILAEAWDKVDGKVKELIWNDILVLTFHYILRMNDISHSDIFSN